MIKESVLAKIEEDFNAIKLMMKYVKENIDSEEEHTPDVIIALIAKEWEFELEDYSYNSIYRLNSHINVQGQKKEILTIELLEALIFEITQGSIVQLVYSYNLLQFGGVTLEANKAVVLKINGRHFEGRYLTEEQIEKMIENLKYLFNDEGSRRADPFDKLKAVFEVFKSGRNSNVNKSYSILVDTANEIAQYCEDETTHEKIRKYNNAIDFILEKYLDYLWSKNDGTLELYILSFDSFVARNKNAWANNLDSAEESLNLFLDEHRESIKMFQELKEPRVDYETKKKRCPPQEARPQKSCKVGEMVRAPLW